MPKEPVIICPFFVRERDKKIACESVVPGCTMLLEFCAVEEKKAYRKRYCQSFSYTKCPIAQMLESSYK